MCHYYYHYYHYYYYYYYYYYCCYFYYRPLRRAHACRDHRGLLLDAAQAEVAHLGLQGRRVAGLQGA